MDYDIGVSSTSRHQKWGHLRDAMLSDFKALLYKYFQGLFGQTTGTNDNFCGSLQEFCSVWDDLDFSGVVLKLPATADGLLLNKKAIATVVGSTSREDYTQLLYDAIFSLLLGCPCTAVVGGEEETPEDGENSRFIKLLWSVCCIFCIYRLNCEVRSKLAAINAEARGLGQCIRIDPNLLDILEETLIKSETICNYCGSVSNASTTATRKYVQLFENCREAIAELFESKAFVLSLYSGAVGLGVARRIAAKAQSRLPPQAMELFRDLDADARAYLRQKADGINSCSSHASLLLGHYLHSEAIIAALDRCQKSIQEAVVAKYGNNFDLLVANRPPQLAKESDSIFSLGQTNSIDRESGAGGSTKVTKSLHQRLEEQQQQRALKQLQKQMKLQRKLLLIKERLLQSQRRREELLKKRAAQASKLMKKYRPRSSRASRSTTQRPTAIHQQQTASIKGNSKVYNSRKQVNENVSDNGNDLNNQSDFILESSNPADCLSVEPGDEEGDGFFAELSQMLIHGSRSARGTTQLQPQPSAPQPTNNSVTIVRQERSGDPRPLPNPLPGSRPRPRPRPLPRPVATQTSTARKSSKKVTESKAGIQSRLTRKVDRPITVRRARDFSPNEASRPSNVVTATPRRATSTAQAQSAAKVATAISQSNQSARPATSVRPANSSRAIDAINRRYAMGLAVLSALEMDTAGILSPTTSAPTSLISPAASSASRPQSHSNNTKGTTGQVLASNSAPRKRVLFARKASNIVEEAQQRKKQRVQSERIKQGSLDSNPSSSSHQQNIHTFRINPAVLSALDLIESFT